MTELRDAILIRMAAYYRISARYPAFLKLCTQCRHPRSHCYILSLQLFSKIQFNCL